MDQTPLMKQYWEIKAQAGDALLFFRMGDFYELFGEDAVEASKILGITLTSRDKSSANPTAMAGVPHHSVSGYIQKLLAAGKKVAIGEQVEDPATAKGIVKRELTRILTPAVQFDSDQTEPRYLGTCRKLANSGKSDLWILAYLEPSTGETLISPPLSEDSLLQEIQQRPPAHWLLLDGSLESLRIQEWVQNLSTCLVEKIPPHLVSQDRAETLLKTQLGVETLHAFVQTPEQIFTLGLLIQYALKALKQEKLSHLHFPLPFRPLDTLRLGPRTPDHLGIESLLTLINTTKTSAGARQLRRWIHQPLAQLDQIHERQKTIQTLGILLNAKPEVFKTLGQSLGTVYDLDRILGRVATRMASPRDTRALAVSLEIIPTVIDSLKKIEGSIPAELKTLLQALELNSERLTPLTTRLLATLSETAPITAREGEIFKIGTDPELDRLIEISQKGESWLVELEAREREATHIPSLKIRYNRVFGYFIEVTKTHLKNVPDRFQRKQSTVNSERFFTEELKTFEDEILTASARRKSLELRLFESVLESIQEMIAPITQISQLIAQLDGFSALARLAALPGWSFPTLDSSYDLEIQAGRHPLVDANSGGKFVPNTLKLHPPLRTVMLITGPNMGGKSTVMRQVALIVLLGQMGAPVPAGPSRWGVFSSLYTRIGAQDAIDQGQSTFMVEMSELAHIFHHADDRSLLILDEIGRGTSTYDGMSVAWSTLEWICSTLRARTLFATHYHELTHLSSELANLCNAHMAVDTPQNAGRSKGPGSLRFLYELREGATNESFGIHVAQMAGIPKQIITRAWKLLEQLEAQPQQHALKSSSDLDSAQLGLFSQLAPPPQAPPAIDPRVEKVLDQLRSADLNQYTPLQALNFLSKLKENADESASESA